MLLDRRAALVALAMISTAFAIGAGVGFVYAHDPQPDDVNVRLNSNRRPADDEVLRGTVLSAGAGTIEIETMLGVKQFRIDPATPVEDLRPLDGTEITSGDSVNIGGSQTRAGFVLTGVVVVGGDGQ